MSTIARKLLVAFLTVALAVTMFPLPAFAEPASGDGEDVFGFEKSAELNALRGEEKNFAEAFDLRQEGTVTSVKQQAPFGSCWGFSAIAAAESSLLANNIAPVDTDMSEKQLVYYSVTHLDDPDNPQNGEGIQILNPRGDAAEKYDNGGEAIMASSLFASGIGPVEESVDEILEYKGIPGNKVSRRVATSYDVDGTPHYENVPLWYSEKDNWSLPENYRFYHSYRLKDSFELPNPTPFIIDENGNNIIDENETTWDDSGILAIKDQLQNHHRAVSVAYSAETFLPGDDTSDKRFISDNWAHYTWDPDCGADHAVTIVGWDDNYPKENFKEGTAEVTVYNSEGEEEKQEVSMQPPADGAWLIKNSWGSELNSQASMTNGYRHFGLLEGQDCVPYDPNAVAEPGNKSTGYFWLSYYDNTLTVAEAFDFDKKVDENNFIAQMDYAPLLNVGMTSCDDSRMANVFTAESTSKLTDVTVLATKPGSRISCEVYLLPDRFSSPEDGLRIAGGEMTCDYGGYHLISLDQQRVLSKGQKYSVIVTETAPESGDYVCCSLDTKAEDMPNVTIVNPNESFYFNGNEWKDLSEEATQEELLDGDDNHPDNFPIKAHLEAVTYKVGDQEFVFDGSLNISNWEEFSPGVFGLQVGESKILAAEFHGIKESMPSGWDPAFEWESGKPETANITKAGNNGDITIKGVSEGSTYLILKAGEDGEWGTRLVNIDVHKPGILYFFLADEEYTYTGKPIKPAIDSIMGENRFLEDGTQVGENLVEGRDYKVVYKNNVNAGTGSVYLIGIGNYGGRTDPETFIIQKAANTLKIKGKTATVKYSKIKAKRQTLKVAKVIKVTKKGQGKLTYAKASGNKKITINKKTGKVTVKKGLKKGTYKVKVKVTAKGNANYKKATRTVTFKVKVK